MEFIESDNLDGDTVKGDSLGLQDFNHDISPSKFNQLNQRIEIDHES
jgi:hypothetical protein